MTGEYLHTSPEIPYLRGYPEWANLVAPNMMASAAHVTSANTDPYLELKRTLASMHALNILLHPDPAHSEITEKDMVAYNAIDYGSDEEDYAQFTNGQPKDSKLSKASFDEVQDFAARTLPTPEDYHRMQYFLLISDAMKNPALMQAVGLQADDNHDTGLVRMFSKEYTAARQQYFPSFDDPTKFTGDDREILQQFVKLMEFNLPGFAQSQLASAHMEAFNEDLPLGIKQQFLLHGLLDVMGAMGGRDYKSALAYTEPSHKMFMHAVTALTGTTEQFGLPADIEMNPFLRERIYLAMRAAHYGVPVTKYQESMRPINEIGLVGPPEQREFAVQAITAARLQELFAQVKLANMMRMDSPEAFATLRRAYHEVPEYSTNKITDLLTISGDYSYNYNFDYGPACIRQILSKDQQSMVRGLRILDYVMSEIQRATNEHIELDSNLDAPWPRTKATVLLRDLAIKSKDPHFTITDYDIIFTAEGNSLTLKLAPRGQAKKE